MVNSWASLGFAALADVGAAFGPEPSHPAKASVIADRARVPAKSRPVYPRIFMEDSLCLPLLSVAPVPSYRKPAPGDKRVALGGSCAPHRENPANSPPHVYMRI